MEAHRNATVLIVDDDEAYCALLDDLISGWGLIPASVTDPHAALRNIIDNDYDVILLDLMMPGVTGFDLMPEIIGRYPDAKIIIMTGFADMDNAINALKLGAFDFLAKPVKENILYHTIRQALETRQKERDIAELMVELDASKAERAAQKKQLEYLDNQLIETNEALSLLARNIDRERDQMEKRIAQKLRSLIMPGIDRLRRIKGLYPYAPELDAVAALVEDITKDFNIDAKIAALLSSA